MPIPGTNVTSLVDTAQLERKLSEMAISTSSIRIPFLSIHQRNASKGEISNPFEWPHRALSKSKVTLSAAFAPGDANIQITAGTTKDPVIIFDGMTELGTADGSLVVRITSTNTAKTVLNYKVISGTHSTTIANGTTLFVTSYTQHGLDIQPHNDGQTYSYDLNYMTNKTLTYQVSKLLQGGYLASYKNKDYTIEDKKLVAGLRQLLELEYDFLASPRIAGSDSSTRNSNTISTDNGSRMGGFKHFLTSGNANEVDAGNKPISLSQLLLDVRYLDQEGAFDEFGTTSERDANTPLLYLYCDRNMKFDWYRLMLQTATGDRLTGDNKFGFSADLLHVGGVDIKIMISNGMGPGEYILEGRPELQECIFIRNREETANTKGVSGDNEKAEEATTVTFCSKAPWLNVRRYNLASLS